jgi:DNA-binding response OmpR family regulator
MENISFVYNELQRSWDYEEITHTIEVDLETKKLPKKQFEILMYLIENKGMILTREQILERAWRDEYGVYDRVVDTHIKKLRALLGSASDMIETVVGVGYMWK